MCPLRNPLHLLITLNEKEEEKTTPVSFLGYSYCGLGVRVTEQLQVSLNILLHLIHDVSHFININLSVLGTYKEPSAL